MDAGLRRLRKAAKAGDSKAQQHLDSVLSGAVSTHKACVEMGWRKPTVTVRDDPGALAEAAMRRSTAFLPRARTLRRDGVLLENRHDIVSRFAALDKGEQVRFPCLEEIALFVQILGVVVTLAGDRRAAACMVEAKTNGEIILAQVAKARGEGPP